MLAGIRQFFAERAVLEVETPLLCQATGSDPNLAAFVTEFSLAPRKTCMYLQTSPEFAMKRLLAADYGCIYQICKAFRKGEQGKQHNPEFTLLEWYRVGFNLIRLMDEIEALLMRLLTNIEFSSDPVRFSYADVFQQYTGLDPRVFSLTNFQRCAEQQGFPEAIRLCGAEHATWLDFLFSHLIQPHLGRTNICMIYDYPACQSSLARTKPEDQRVVERVEVFINGVELGNGYYELNDAIELEQRFDRELLLRKQKGLPVPDKDQRLLAALHNGIPDCAGMALGLDRLLMIAAGQEDIAGVIAFPINRA